MTSVVMKQRRELTPDSMRPRPLALGIHALTPGIFRKPNENTTTSYDVSSRHFWTVAAANVLYRQVILVHLLSV